MPQTAVIVIDSGFSAESLEGAPIVGLCNLNDSRAITGAPWVSREDIQSFAGDPMGHGSIVLSQIRQLAPAAPLILIRAYGSDRRLIRSAWHDGVKVSAGWTEAYLWAAKYCRQLGLCSVANCSFGGFTHAMDGTGWESLQLGVATGAGKPGHVVVAAAGPGDGRAAHASFKASPGETVSLRVFQEDTTSYNFWTEAQPERDWVLEVWRGEHLLFAIDSERVPENFWNGRQQATFQVEGSGQIKLVFHRRGTTGGEARFDCWVTGNMNGSFLDRVDPTLIAEPAIFPQVLSVGLRKGSYSPEQTLPGGKPDILLPGGGAISFRLPEVTTAVAALLSDNPAFDIESVRLRLGKYPVSP